MSLPASPPTAFCASVVRRVVASPYSVAPFGAAYAALLLPALSDPAALDGFSNSATVAGVAQALGSPTGAAVGWVHFIAQDFFVGRYVYLDGLRHDVFSRHSLLLCFLFGPLG